MEFLEINSKQPESESETSSVASRMLQLQREYYDSNRKHFIFKKNQKQECAEMICARMSLDDLLKETFWVIPDTNRLFFDYTVFKTYANPDNYPNVIDKVLIHCVECVEKYDCFEVHVNLAGFTVSAAERYKIIIEMFCRECLNRNKRFNVTLQTMNLYNIPNMVDQLSRMLMPLIPPEVRPKIRLFRKPESEKALTELHNTVLSQTV
jgi:hypothetical protein